MRLAFFGATDTVTGSRFLVEHHGRRILVDCGLFQGVKALRERNWEPFPVDPGEIDAVVLTHAHIDHSGYLPALVRDGFRGAIWATNGTRRLASILLPDAAHLQEEEAEFRNRHGTTRHKPALPLYTAEDAAACLASVESVGFDEVFDPIRGVSARFTPAGHILGAGCVHLTVDGRTLVFSGDVGRPGDPIMNPPRPIERADWLVVESTYGDRRHDPTPPKDVLAAVIARTAARGGIVLVPSFAVGRTQSVLRLVWELREEGRIPRIPVFLNSPMAVEATKAYLDHDEDHRLSTEDCDAIERMVTVVSTVEESKQLNTRTAPAIVVSASGMLTGGRVVHHLQAWGPDPKNTVLLVGFQAPGTRGEALLNGVDEIKMFGSYTRIRAEIAHVSSLSAHADQAELLAWLRSIRVPPRRTFVVHGNPSAQDALRRRLGDDLGWEAVVPSFGQAFDLG